MRGEDTHPDLTTLAEGGPDPEAARHVEACPACAARLSELRRVVAAARLPQRDARPELVARARGLVPVRRRLVARLLGNALAGAGARSVKTDDFALRVGAEDVTVDLRYTAVAGAWRVAGRAPDDEGWTLVRDGDSTPCGPAGRFRLSVPSLEDAAFVLRKDALEVEVPSARELIDGGP